MAYRDDISALGANHLWIFETDANDSIGVLNGTNSGGVFTGPALCEDASNSYETNGTTDTITFATDPSVQDVTSNVCHTHWFRTSAIQQPPCRVSGDGGQTVNQSFFLGFGNSIVAEVDTDPDILQVGSSVAIEANRSYCLTSVFSDEGGGNYRLSFYIDGVLQGTADGTDVLSTARGGLRIGGINNTTSYTIGGVAFQLVSPVNGYYGFYANFVSANVPTATEIREEIFEKGALPGVTISSDTEANMQTALNAYSSTVRPNEPLNIRIEAVTGDGDLALNADNITHNFLASCHIQYMGTGTLTWTNNNGSNTSIGSTPNGGTINFINPVNLTVSPLIADSEVRVYEAGTTNEVGGIESSGTSFNTSISVSAVDVVIHKEDYENVRVKNLDMSSGDVSLPVSQNFDRNYGNP